MAIKWIKPIFKTEEHEFTGHFFHWMKNVAKTDFNMVWHDIKRQYDNAIVETLNDDDWSNMRNTDSWRIHNENDLFDVIHGMCGRDKERILNYSINPIKEGRIVEAPIVFYAIGHAPYLIAGNTRLSVCRMLGIMPMVVKIHMTQS